MRARVLLGRGSTAEVRQVRIPCLGVRKGQREVNSGVAKCDANSIVDVET
jgi:hypothetical protein